ncbi:hypothetical protein DFH29DRAFT_875737 [Suillus ampliporus]|nr:hypothetical protein DFH29DRAFT_875737 [Suillus ampliporus]
MPNSFDSHPSDFNDGMEALLTGAAEPVDVCEGDSLISQIRSYTPDSTQSHDHKNCPGQGAYGQGAPVYPCGCYQYSKIGELDFHNAYLQELEHPKAGQVTDASEAEQRKRIEQEINDWNMQVEDSSEVLPPKRKRLTSDVGDVTPHQFGQNMTNVGRAVSVPVLEVSQKLKRRKLAKPFEFKGNGDALQALWHFGEPHQPKVKLVLVFIYCCNTQSTSCNMEEVSMPDQRNELALKRDAQIQCLVDDQL